MTKLKVEHLKKSFGNLEVLKDLNVEVQEGEVICIIGPSGSGKSTFLRCMNALEDITGGKVIIDDFDLTDPKQDINKVRENIGMVFQQFNLFPHLTVLDNITLAPKELKKESTEAINKRALELLETVGLSEKAADYPKSLSGGQKQRVAIARALAMNPDIMLFDEPTSALDPSLKNEVVKVINDLKKQKQTMIIITHDMEFADSVADKIIKMENGQIIEER